MGREQRFIKRCVLFVPADRPDRYEKAIDSGVDAICIDLEDAVRDENKDGARIQLCDFLAAHPLAESHIGVRINALRTCAGMRDVLALTELSKHGVSPAFVLLPKTVAPAEVEVIRTALGDAAPALIPLIECPNGLAASEQIAATQGVSALMFGGADFSAAIQAEFSWEPLMYARQRVAAAAGAAGISAIDVPYIHLSDTDGLAEETRRIIGFGFSCKAAIHPNQVAIIQDAFLPTEDQLAFARKVIDAGVKGAQRVDGRMVDQPVIDQARRTIAYYELAQAQV